ncbi:MAG: hypothetical protein IPK82_21010 [Polyangiaceae bacterium]|nr:hypothetical protein [Polyangiaceae bacterium]
MNHPLRRWNAALLPIALVLLGAQSALADEPPPAAASSLPVAASTPPAVENKTADGKVLDNGQKTPDPAEVERQKLRFVVGVGILGTLGVSPNVGFGLLAHAEVRRSIWSVGLEGRLDVPIPAPLDGGGNLVTTLVTGRVTPCLHMSVLFGCAVVSVGALFGSTDGVANPAKQTTPFVSAGLRFGANWAVLPKLHLRGQFDAEATLTPTTFMVDNLPVWTTLPFNGSLTFLALVPFP